MFSKTLDEKSTYIDDDGNEVVDLSEGIFDNRKRMTTICSIFRANRLHEMRPDKISIDLYGTSDYTEMILKYAMIDNPFSVEMDDIVFSPKMDSIYNPIKDDYDNDSSVFDAVKNMHKYIDKSKVPNKVGSDSVSDEITETPVEANISKTGNSGVTVKNGKLYFGEIDEKLKSVDSSIVDCATDGTSLGDFLNAVLRNNNG